ncbi:PAS domain-containing protein [Stutzerimonas kirkiae]|uniref:Aerotaxis receptor Aer n=1 Tax=Stutzerimonas kirkiae TaxID=2211392 RepID=A0A4Q9R3A1_9GAMM|nr:PAS domain-containing protein [Stutzerimonas kirkiae]TBU94062.1 aerotaxis receptor Aer [Stutzerimonas kirkiae]TBV06122.1 aerotaxis receptor Aer [Stutzerimonas kirkiae]TBV06564.1 aerotaxis receptor Aer [Stutzerimonas kirkiae]TBV13713.1 aerotaxis receptor Aer [Stutzerimonas kirkiae]
MKSKVALTGREVRLGDNEQIISKTDLKGRIIYANRPFMRISDFAEPDLLGIQHNIVRHPQMPRGVFHMMWETLKSGQEFFGFIQNLTANGDHYWVFANVTPDQEPGGKVVGYFSVRRRPSARGVATIQALYADMLAVESNAGPARAIEASRAYLAERLGQQSYERFVLALQLG